MKRYIKYIGLALVCYVLISQAVVHGSKIMYERQSTEAQEVVEPGEEFTVHIGQTVRIADQDITLKLTDIWHQGCSLDWDTDLCSNGQGKFRYAPSYVVQYLGNEYEDRDVRRFTPVRVNYKLGSQAEVFRGMKMTIDFER